LVHLKGLEQRFMAKARLEKLESIRGLAAVYVVLHHLARTFLPHRWYRLPFVFGPEAVMIFFVLSGFVIYYSSAASPVEMQLRNYSVKRIRRIYPIFLCALVIAYFCHAIVLRSWFVPSWKLAAGNLLMFQGISIDPFYNGPLWSLSYEWWFYVLFFIVAKIEKRPQNRQFWAAGISLLGLVTAVIYLNQASLFLLYFVSWWSGAELARQYMNQGRITWRGQRFSLAALAGAAILSTLLVIPALRAHQPLSFIDIPLLFCRHLFSALVLISVGIIWYKRQFVGFNWLIGPFAVFAPISYAIYAIHAPIIEAVASVDPAWHVAGKLAIIVIIVLTMGYMLEVVLQPRVNRWTNRFLTRKPPVGGPGNMTIQEVAAA
jgi:peptidoglycan/LPS O-acetylase OafA/YrhL